MNPSYYKYCIVPECRSTTSKTPEKLFIYVPNNKKVRRQWLTLAGRADADDLSTGSRIYVCEDHFDLPNDMSNYMEYYIMGKVSQIRMKPGRTPTKFECQGDGRKRKSCTKQKSKKFKKQNTLITPPEECNGNGLQDVHRDKIKMEIKVEVEEISCEQTDNGTVIEKNTIDKAVQTESESKPTSDIVKKIKTKPLFYIGLPIRCYYLIEIIKNELNIPEHHLLLCLNKIKLNKKSSQLMEDYGLTPLCISNLFIEKIPLIASVLRPFIVADRDTETIPVPFRKKFTDISCIIQCLEIEIQKPLKATYQAQTWSKTRQAYIVKYLIAYTPNGIVNYISPMYGGRITDACLVESCGYLKKLISGTCVVAEGLENLEHHVEFPVTLRPQNVTVCKSEGVNKQIANFRTHVERVQRCLFQFRMLKQNARLPLKYVKILDDIVTIVCAFINLQCDILY